MTATSPIHDPADPSAEAAVSRAAALERDTLGHYWRKQPLYPWTKRREIFFLALEKLAQESSDFVESCANSLDELALVEKQVAKVLAVKMEENGVAVELPTGDSLINWHAFLASASRVLWLAHHTVEDWSHLRANPEDWLRLIEDWSDEFIKAPEIIAAVRLAHLLRTEHQQFITMPRPEKPRGKIEPGN